MPLDGTSSTSVCAFANRVDRLAAEAHEVGLGHAAVVLAHMADLLRSMSGEAATTTMAVVDVVEPFVAVYGCGQTVA